MKTTARRRDENPNDGRRNGKILAITPCVIKANQIVEILTFCLGVVILRVFMLSVLAMLSVVMLNVAALTYGFIIM